MSKETVIQELARIRQGLLSPAQLWAKVEERFAAEERSRGAVTQQVSKGDRVERTWHLVGTDLHCAARSKSEARSLMKKMLGQKLPSGSIIEMVT